MYVYMYVGVNILFSFLLIDIYIYIYIYTCVICICMCICIYIFVCTIVCAHGTWMHACAYVYLFDLFMRVLNSCACVWCGVKSIMLL